MAEVVNGRICANGVGDAILICRLQEDEKVFTRLFVHVNEAVTGIAFINEEILLVENDINEKTGRLKLMIEPKNGQYDQITYKSSNEKVAIVTEDGIVEAKGVGSAVITAIVSAEGMKNSPKCSAKVNVIKKVLMIADNASTVMIPVNSSKKLSPSILPKDASNKKLKWESSDESIAQVDANGNVKGIKIGECSVICSSVDGGNVKHSYDVKVLKPVKGLRVNSRYKANASIFGEAGETLQLSSAFVIDPADATVKTLKYEVLSNKMTPISVMNYNLSIYQVHKIVEPQTFISFVFPGVYVVKAVTTDGSNKSASLKYYIGPKDRMTIEFNYARWDFLSNDRLGISFELTNKEYGAPIRAVELYVYATDIWGKKIYGESVYYSTTEKNIEPGKSIYSERVIIPDRSKISQVYCGVHKIRFSDGETKTYDKVNYSSWNIK